jgi:ADP-heptose:LPS heptosyltransferase
MFLSRNLYKCWTTDGWETVIRHLISKGIAVVLTGASGETENTHINTIIERGFDSNLVNLAGKINLPQASDLLSGTLFYLGTDTGMTHLAAAQAIPTIAIFGPSIPAQWGPGRVGIAKMKHYTRVEFHKESVMSLWSEAIYSARAAVTRDVSRILPGQGSVCKA